MLYDRNASRQQEYCFYYKVLVDLAYVKIIEFISKEDFNSPYFMSLYNDNKVSVLSMNIQYQDLFV